MAGSDILLCDTYGTDGKWSCKDTYATSESQPRTYFFLSNPTM